MAKKYNMDGISDAYFSSDKQYKDYTNTVSAPKKQTPPKQTAVKEPNKQTSKATGSQSRHNDSNDRSKGQYEKILGISDPAFSGGDAYAAYGDYLKRIAKENEPPANDQSVVEMAVRTKTANIGSPTSTVPDWINSVSFPIQTTPYAEQASKSRYSVGIMPVNQDTPQQILAQRNNQQQTANSIGAFRLAAQQADEKSANNARIKAAMEAGAKVALEHGLASGSMPLPQYGSQATPPTYSTGIMPANKDTSQQILTQRANKEKITNSMGGFKQAEQKADEKSAYWANADVAKDANRDVIQKYGLSAGTMPVSQYASQPTTSSYPTGIMPANKDTPLQVLAQRTGQEQFAKSIGKFRQATQQADEKSAFWANANAFNEANRDVNQKYGLGAGTMPIQQYGSQTTKQDAIGTPNNVYLVPSTLPINNTQYVKGTDTSGYLEYLDRTGQIASIVESVGDFAKGEFGDFLSIGGKSLSLATSIVKFTTVLNQDLNDDDKEIGMPTLIAACGLLGNIAGEAVGYRAFGPVGAVVVGYLGEQLITKYMEDNSEPVSYEKALERTKRFTSPFMPKNAQSPQEMLNARQARKQASTGRGDAKTLEQQDEAHYEQLANAQFLMDDLSQYARDNRISSMMP